MFYFKITTCYSRMYQFGSNPLIAEFANGLDSESFFNEINIIICEFGGSLFVGSCNHELSSG